VARLSLRGVLPPPTGPEELKSKESMGYSLNGINSGLVMKRTRVHNAKTSGLFARDWPEWISVETAFHLDLNWICLKESTCVAKLALIYPTVTFIAGDIGVNLPPVNFVFCSQWIPPVTHALWKCEMLEVLFATVHKLRFIKVLDWVSVLITIKHSYVGGCSAMEWVVRAFVKTKDMVVNLETEKRPARSVASICKDHHYGNEVPVQESRSRLIPLVHETRRGVYHGDGLHPGDEPKAPLFVFGSCRSKSGWCKRRLQASKVLSMYDISDSITKCRTDELRSKLSSLIIYPRSKFYLARRTQF
jgi:hypothetical protein